MDAPIYASSIPHLDYTRPSGRRGAWPYLVGALAALALAAAAVVVLLANLEAARTRAALLASPTPTPEHLAAIHTMFAYRKIAYVLVLGGHALAFVAWLGLASHGHRIGVALAGSAVCVAALAIALGAGGDNSDLMLVGLVGSIVAIAGLGLVRDLGTPARIVAFAAALVALHGLIAPGIEIVAPVASGAAYLAFALRMRALRVAPY